METLSVIIITKNAAACIERCLKSVAWAQEIIVLDAGSEDETVSLCRRYTPHVIETDWPGFGQQKNRALNRASQSYVLSLDADEWLTPELQQAIQTVLKNPTATGYYLKRHNFYWGRLLKHGNDGPEYLLRLFKREQGRFTDVSVHERLMVEGTTKTLQPPLLHEPYTSVRAWIDKMNHYSTLSAEQKRNAGKKAHFLQLIYKPLWFFVRGYFLKAGFLDGQAGFICALLNGISTYFRYLKLYVDQKNE